MSMDKESMDEDIQVDFKFLIVTKSSIFVLICSE